jgi:hypothetical protein
MAMMLLGSVVPAQQGIPEFSISISAPESVMAGGRIPVEIIITNTSSHVIAFDGDDLNRGERNFNIDVRDAMGVSPPELPYLKAIRGEDQEGPTRLVVNGKFFQREIKPGESLHAGLNLAELYDLRPGMYTVSLWRPDLRVGHTRRGPEEPKQGSGTANSQSSSAGNELPRMIVPKAISRSNAITIRAL